MLAFDPAAPSQTLRPPPPHLFIGIHQLIRRFKRGLQRSRSGINTRNTKTRTRVIEPAVVKLVATNQQRHQPSAHRCGSFGHFVRVDRSGQADHNELVTTPAPKFICCPQPALQAPAAFDQELVPHLVPVGVVDRLEFVEVDKCHQHPLPRSLRQREMPMQGSQDRTPVLQPGQRVIVGCIAFFLAAQ